MSRIDKTSESEGSAGIYTEVRRAKREDFLSAGEEPYADRFETTHTLQEAAGLADGTTNVSIAGRMVSFRHLGKLVFGHISCADGKLQFAAQKETLAEEFGRFDQITDIGDYIGISGEIITTRTGEKTLNVLHWKMLSKALRPLPEKFHGIVDKEQVLRKRYLDLIMSSESVSRFHARTKIINFLRYYLNAHDFIEIDTPILTNNASGAIATPFSTHHNALDIDVYLRIAPETYLKRAVAGGFERVYEIARCFRNEGMDRSHLPDFTMLEYYAAYWNYKDNMAFTEKMLKQLLQSIIGDLAFEYQGRKIDFSQSWQTRSFRDLLKSDAGIDILESNDV